MLLNKVVYVIFACIHVIAVLNFLEIAMDPNLAVGFYAVVRASFRASLTNWKETSAFAEVTNLTEFINITLIPLVLLLSMNESCTIFVRTMRDSAYELTDLCSNR